MPFWKILKDLIGKDLTKVSMPVYFNEPTSITQKSAETLEYHELLDRAANEPDSQIRLVLVTTYMAVRASSIPGRMQKPFNSLLGETYELITERFRSITEQVSHHPPITAVHCESKSAIVYSASSTTMKFNGRYISFYPKEPVYIVLKLPSGIQEEYECQLPHITIHNLIFGKLYIDLMGKTMCTNLITRESSETVWKEKGWSSANYNLIESETRNEQGMGVYRVFGNFTKYLKFAKAGVSDDEAELLWAARPKPE